jgi:hypothetical protein
LPFGTPTANEKLATAYPTPNMGDRFRRRHVGNLLESVANVMWPTPSASGFECADVPKLLARRERCKEKGTNGNGFGLTLNQAVKVAMFPMPTARDFKSGKGKTQAERGRTAGPSLSEASGGSLNPTWVEWLMGFPLEWTVCDAWGTRSSRRSSKSSGEQ